MTNLNPTTRTDLNGAVARFFTILASAIGSFLFVWCVSVGASIYHLRDVISGREKKNRPKADNASDNYTPRQPYPDLKHMRMSTDLGYYARQLGLDLELYDITTADGHILILHRIIDPKDTQHTRDSKPPILLQHGLLLCSGAWLAPGTNSLPYYFMEQGYDVWMGNNRCGFKPRHAEFKHRLMHNEKVWDWDVRHLAYYDLPCIIDTVLAHKPHHAKLYLVGHLQGCTQSLILLRNGDLKDYHKKIDHCFLLAPAAFPGSLFYDRSFIKFIHSKSPRMYNAIFGNCCFLAILSQLRSLIGTSRIFSLLSYQIFKYLFGWNIRNSYNNRKVIHLQFLFNASCVSARLMAWWLSYSVEEGFLNQLQPKKAYEQGTTADFTPINSVKSTAEHAPADATEKPAHLPEFVDDSKSFFPYKKEWFTCDTKEEIVPMSVFIGGEDFLVDGSRFATHMKHYERRYYQEGANLEVVELPDYNHLDVIWALNCIGKIGMNINDTIKRTEVNEKV